MCHTPSMKITLSESLSERVTVRAVEHGFTDAERFIESLLEQEGQLSMERVEALLAEGLESGTPIEVTPGFWEGHKRRFLARFPDAAPNM